MRPRTRMRITSALLMSLLLFPATVQAQVTAAPAKMTFQGRLAKPDGTPVPDGTYSVRFSLHDALTGGNEKWNQTLGSVTVKNGTFAALLDVNTANLFNGDLYLQIKIGTDAPLTPRQPLVSVPYAMKANTVPDGSIGASQIANGSITADKLTGDALNNLSWLLGGNAANGSQFLGTTNSQPLVFKTNNVERLRIGNGGGLLFPGAFGAKPDYVGFDGNFLAFGHPGVSEDAISYKNNTFFFKDSPEGGDTADPNVVVGGNLGIGIDTPDFPLSFANSLGDKISLWGGAEDHYGFGIQAGLLQIHSNSAGSDIAFGYGPSAAMTEVMRIKGNGNVGIGTNAPGAKLDVRGAGGVNVFAGDLSPVGQAAYETNFFSPQTHAWFMENGNRVFSVGGNGATHIASSLSVGSSATIAGNLSTGSANISGNLSVGASASITGNISAGSATINGSLLMSSHSFMLGANTLEFGAGVSGKHHHAGKIGYQAYSNALDIVGAGTNETNRRIKLWAEGGTQLTGPLLFPDGTSQSTATVSSSGWSLTGNSGTNPATQFLGTTDNQPLTIRANNRRAMQWQYATATDSANNSYMGNNLLGGYEANFFTPGVVAATIGGGGLRLSSPSGTTDQVNSVTDIAGTVSGGAGNKAGNSNADVYDARYAFVGGGYLNTASGERSVAAGGFFNVASGASATIAGGEGHAASGPLSFVGGGQQNIASGNGSTVAGGKVNKAENLLATVGGGGNNSATEAYAIVAGGFGNTATKSGAAVGGGNINAASGNLSTIAGGISNIASGDYSTVGGGQNNVVSNVSATVAGGNFNQATGPGSAISGGGGNVAFGNHATVGGGSNNDARADSAVISGGQQNVANGFAATVPGGYFNQALGAYSFAAGRRATTTHTGTFIWNDSTNIGFNSTGDNQFLIRASGGVGINENSPLGFALSVGGAIFCTTLTQSSDGRYKQRVLPFENALDTILDLRGVTFDWNQDAWKEKNFPEGRQIGFIAQEVEKVLPELVTTDSKGYKSVAYQNVVPILVEAIKTQQQQRQADRAEIADLKARLERLEAALLQMQK